MRKFSSISKAAAAAIVGSALFVGCGSSLSSLVSSAGSVSGLGLAAYINGGKAFLDANKDGILNNGELSGDTNATGSFTITGTIPSEYNLVISGGTNSDTGVALPYPTTAPKGFTKVSPVTTMLSSMNDAEQENFMKDLGFGTNLAAAIANINAIDYNKAASSDTLAKVAAKITAVKTQVETILASTGSSSASEVSVIATAFKNAVQNLAGSSDVNLTQLNSGLGAAVAAASTAAVAAGTISTGIDQTTLTADLTSVASQITALNTASTSSLTAAQIQAEIDTQKAIAEKANAINAAKVVAAKATTFKLASQDVKFGTETVTVYDDNSFVKYHAPLSASEELSKFFDISFSINTAEFAKTIEKTAELSVAITYGSKMAKIVVPDIAVEATKDGKLNISVPSGTTITATSANITGVPTSATAATTSNLVLAETDGNVAFSINTLLNALGSSTTIQSYIDSFNAKARLDNVTYNVAIGYKITNEDPVANDSAIVTALRAVLETGINGDSNATTTTAIDGNITTSIVDSNISSGFADLSSTFSAGYTGFAGKIIVASDMSALVDADASTVTASKSSAITSSDNNITFTVTTKNSSGTALGSKGVAFYKDDNTSAFGSTTTDATTGIITCTYDSNNGFHYTSGKEETITVKETTNGVVIGTIDLKYNALPSFSHFSATAGSDSTTATDKNVTVAEGNDIVLTWLATDSDADALTYTLSLNGSPISTLTDSTLKTYTLATDATTVSADTNYTYTITATDSVSSAVSSTDTIIVTVQENTTPTFSSVSNQTLTVDTAMTSINFSTLFTDTGDTLTYAMNSACATLPTGLSFTSGILSGTPTVAGSSATGCIVTATDSLSQTASSNEFNVSVVTDPTAGYTHYVWGVGGADNNKTVTITGTDYTVAPYSSSIDKNSSSASTSGFVSVFNGVVNNVAFTDIKPSADYASTNIMLKVVDASGNVVGYSTAMDVGTTGSVKSDVNITF